MKVEASTLLFRAIHLLLIHLLVLALHAHSGVLLAAPMLKRLRTLSCDITRLQQQRKGHNSQQLQDQQKQWNRTC